MDDGLRTLPGWGRDRLVNAIMRARGGFAVVGARVRREAQRIQLRGNRTVPCINVSQFQHPSTDPISNGGKIPQAVPSLRSGRQKFRDDAHRDRPTGATSRT